MVGCFHLFFKVLWRYYWKTTLITILTNSNNLKCFEEKIKVGLHKYNFSPVTHGWRVFPNNKRCGCSKNNICKIDLFPSKQTWSPAFLRTSIKYVVSKAVPVVLSGSQKVLLLTAVAIQSAFSDDSCKGRKMNMQR